MGEAKWPRVETLHDGSILTQRNFHDRVDVTTIADATELHRMLGVELGIDTERPADKIAAGLKEAAAVAPALASEYARGRAEALREVVEVAKETTMAAVERTYSGYTIDMTAKLVGRVREELGAEIAAAIEALAGRG